MFFVFICSSSLLISTNFYHLCLFLTGESLSDQVNWNPLHLITNAEKTVQLSCSHAIKDYYTLVCTINTQYILLDTCITQIQPLKTNMKSV